MKRSAFVIILLFGALAIHSSDTGFTLNLSFRTDTDFSFSPLIWGAGAQLDFHMASNIMISPEATLYGNIKFESASMMIAPGATLNFMASALYLGGGVVKFIALSSSSTEETPFMLKLNGGLRGKGFRMGIYLLTPFSDLFNDISLGLQIGFEF